MLSNYQNFINEKKEMIISLSDVERIINSIFSESKVMSIKNTYEQNGDELKLIITLNNLFYDQIGIILTKLIFFVDKEKRKLTKHEFLYLKDINGVYKNVGFTDSDDLQGCIKGIFKNNKFGSDIKALSILSLTLTSRVNEYIDSGISIYNITYCPKIDNLPSDNLIFNFKINVNNTDEIDFNVKKIDGEFELSFSLGEWIESITTPNVKSIPQTIAEMIKKRYK